VTARRFLIDENLSPALVEPARRHTIYREA
jgi:hypothetical protein